jgi:hypothetical protein
MQKKHDLFRGSLVVASLAAMFIFWTSCLPDFDVLFPTTEIDKLPAMTQEGKNTFGCLVDGKAWVKERSGLLHSGLNVGYDEDTGQFGIVADNKQISYCSLNCEGQYVRDTVQYDMLVDDISFMDTSTICNEILKMSVYYCSKGYVKINHLSLETGIISDTFAFEAYDKVCNDTIRVTDGRFDVRYKY